MVNEFTINSLVSKTTVQIAKVHRKLVLPLAADDIFSCESALIRLGRGPWLSHDDAVCEAAASVPPASFF